MKIAPVGISPINITLETKEEMSGMCQTILRAYSSGFFNEYPDLKFMLEIERKIATNLGESPQTHR